MVSYYYINLYELYGNKLNFNQQKLNLIYKLII